MGQRQEGKVRASLFPPRGGQSKGTRDGTGRSRQPRAQPGIAAFPGARRGWDALGSRGSGLGFSWIPPSLKLPRFVTVCRNNKISFGWH